MNLDDQVPGVTSKIVFLPRGGQEFVNGDLSSTHTTSQNGIPVLIDQTTATAYKPEEVAGVASGPENEEELRSAGYQVMDRAKLLLLLEK
jgi:hypothetical protein